MPDVPGRRSTLVAGLALVTLVASFLVSYTRARAEGLGLDAKVGIAERAERLIVMIIGLIFDLVLAALWILSVASVVTLLQRIIHVRRQVRS
jgi:CDP-diacylglycerol--glycerol-3-phosphate 3-phosphatidyltransferase